jgi:protein TonB
MKYVALFCVLVLSSGTMVYSQTDSTTSPLQTAKQPEFPGGINEMFKYLQENMVYPELARQEGVEARVIIRFNVTAEGLITDVVQAGYTLNPNDSIAEKLAPLFIKEAKRVIEAMPPWTPGTQGGKPVQVAIALPISFKLQ